jgi:2'-hydroxyisoflavone reductase
MRLLLLGGTTFLGRHTVEAARLRGHSVTLFNRGRTAPGLWLDVEELQGDRDGGLTVLRGRTWDCVIDTSGYIPRIVRDSAELLCDSVGYYLFVSSVSVYEGDGGRIDESSPLARLSDPSTEEVTGETYGGLKVACERVVSHVFRERAAIVRPGLVVGPHDPTDRFTYWVRRAAEGGEVLAPGRPSRRVQVIDARDLGRWMVSLCERAAPGVFNATGPDVPLTMGDMLATCREVSGSDAHFTWVDEEELVAAGVRPWEDLPLWLLEKGREVALDRVDSSLAVSAGLRLRPIEETIADTLEWDAARPRGRLAAGIDRRREADLLSAHRSGGARLSEPTT